LAEAFMRAIVAAGMVRLKANRRVDKTPLIDALF